MLDASAVTRPYAPRADQTLQRNVSRVVMTSADSDCHAADLRRSLWPL
jgi:hypothetical protein